MQYRKNAMSSSTISVCGSVLPGSPRCPALWRNARHRWWRWTDVVDNRSSWFPQLFLVYVTIYEFSYFIELLHILAQRKKWEDFNFLLCPAYPPPPPCTWVGAFLRLNCVAKNISNYDDIVPDHIIFFPNTIHEISSMTKRQCFIICFFCRKFNSRWVDDIPLLPRFLFHHQPCASSKWQLASVSVQSSSGCEDLSARGQTSPIPDPWMAVISNVLFEIRM